MPVGPRWEMGSKEQSLRDASLGGCQGLQDVLALTAIPMPANSILDILRHTQVTGRTQTLLLPGVPAELGDPLRHPPQLLLQRRRCKELQSPLPSSPRRQGE